MKVSDFDYELPAHLIAQSPAEPRDSSRLMLLDRDRGCIAHHRFNELGSFLRPGDVLVLNDTRVMPARLAATKRETGGTAEILLLRQLDAQRWLTLVRGRGIRIGAGLRLNDSDITAEVVEEHAQGQRVLRFSRSLQGELEALGQTPLPPYIQTHLEDHERYQTVYSRNTGSAAAPTAGLHFTTTLLESLQRSGVLLARCTLHIGLDTFLPLRVEDVERHRMHSEYARLNTEAASTINSAARAGGRIIAVGTTSARTLETATAYASAGEHVGAFAGDTSLFITPGYCWRVVDALLTNFHLPRSTLLMMVSALAGRERVLHSYALAREHGYRFYSFGDAMFICPRIHS